MPWRSIQSLLLYMVQTVYPNLRRDFCLTSSQVRVPYAALSMTKLSDAVQSIYSLDRRNINILDYQSITARIKGANYITIKIWPIRLLEFKKAILIIGVFKKQIKCSE